MEFFMTTESQDLCLTSHPKDGKTTEEEPKGWRSRRDEAQPEAWSPEDAGWSMTDQGGAGGTRKPGGVSRQMGHGGEEGARRHGGADRSTGRGGVRGLEAGVEGYSGHGNAGGWQCRGTRTV